MQPDVLAQDTNSRSILAELESLVGPRNFGCWFRGKTTLTIDADGLTINVGSPFVLNWIQKHFRAAVLSAAHKVLGPAAEVGFQVDARLSLKAADGNTGSGRNGDTGNPAPKVSAGAPAADSTPRGRRFADLSDLVKGPCNELPLTAALQVSDAPGRKFSPLFLHGTVGVGKTHLLEGIYRRTRRQFPSLKVMFLSCEAFANYFTQALRERTLPGFRQRFRTVDVLLVDDVDFLDGKRGIQEEFLHTFKQLESHQKQIVLSADRHPRLLMKSSDELTTRFVSGLVCRLEAPCFETRKKIVARKASQLKARISNEVITFVAQRFRNNVRELEGALNCLETYHSMTGKRVTLSSARRILADLERDCIRVVRMSDIEQTVCDFFGVEPHELKSPRRSQSISRPRMLAMFLARKHTQAAYSEIGNYFGGRNHSTVMSAERKVSNWLEEETPIRIASRMWQPGELMEALEHQLQAG